MVLAESAVLGLAAGAVPGLSVESVVETLHTCPVASALASSSLEAGTLAGGGVGVGEAVTDGEGVRVAGGVVPGVEEEVLELAKAGGAPSSSVEASPARMR